MTKIDVVAAPPARDRMAGRYFSQCPGCRTGRCVGPDCGGGGPVPPRVRRKREKRALGRFLAQGTETAPPWA